MDSVPVPKIALGESMITAAAVRRGPRPANTPRQVLEVAAEMLLRGELPEMAALADQTGVGRTSLYRWFGDRDALVGEVLSTYLEEALQRGYRRTRARGGRRVARAIEALIRDATSREPLLRLLRAQPQIMLRIIMSPTGSVHRRSIATVAALIEREQQTARYRPVLDAQSLAYILVQSGQAFTWVQAATGQQPDVAETIRVSEALLLAEPKH